MVNPITHLLQKILLSQDGDSLRKALFASVTGDGDSNASKTNGLRK